MYIRHLIAVAVFMLMPLTAGNLIVNGDFEDTANDAPKGWVFAGYGSVNEVSAAGKDGGFIRGTVSLHIKHASLESAPGTKPVVAVTEKRIEHVIGGAEYRLSFYAKSPVAGQSVTVYYYTGAGKKPHFYKLKTFIVSATWTKYVFTQKLMGADDWNDRDLFIRFDVPFGELYIDDVVLEENSGEAVMAAGAQANAAQRKNILNNPGFELGWLGWGPQSYRTKTAPYEVKEIPSAMDTSIKYEGAASLRIEPNGCIGSMRYAVELGKPYTFSFYAKAEPASGENRAVNFFVITPTWKIMRQPLIVGKDIGPEWKRYSIPVNITEQGAAFRNTVYLRIDSQDNTVWVDAAQLEKGDMTAYEPGVQAGIVSKNERGLFSLGKPEDAAVVLNTGGIAQAFTVSLTARDAVSNIIWKKDIPFAAAADGFSTIPLRLENKTLGVTEVSAVVTAAAGDAPLSVNKWRYCVIDGSAETTRQNPLFGTENIIGGNPEWLEDFNERMANAAGSGFSRVFIWHGNGEDGADPATLAMLKRQLMRKKAGGKTVMICIGKPKGAKIDPGQKFDEEPSEALVNDEITRFALYAGKLASALTDTVDYYQLLNEPNIWYARSGTKKGLRLMAADRYIRFVAAGSAAVRAAYPKARIAANINGIDLTYSDAFFAAGGAKHIDAFTFHSYRGAPENPAVYEDIRRLRTLVDKYAKGMPIFNDEQYFGVRDMIAHSGEDDRDYYSDTEEEHTGRILQNFLHHAAANVPHSQFAVSGTLYRYGMNDPVYFYPAFGGYRFMSQTLYDIVTSSTVDVNPAVRAFLFERRDGTKIVSLNTRMFGVKGGIRKCAADAAFDMNGNRRAADDVPLSFIPSYLSFKPGTSADAVITALKRADFYGFDAPIRASFEVDNGALAMTVENCENRTLDTAVTFLKMPEGWTTPAPIDVKALAARATKRFTIPMSGEEFVWSKDYTIDYRAVVGDSIISKSVRLPSIFAGKRAVTVDGDLSDWKGAAKMLMSEDNLSADFSGGKIQHTGPDDVSASAAAAWDNEYVYIAVKVTDDNHFTGEGEETRFWMHDSVQLYFDMANDAGKTYDGNDASYSVGINKAGAAVAFLDKNPTGRYVGAANADKGIDGDVKTAWQKTASGYIIEMAFPRAALPYLEFREGYVFGFSLLVNDNDGAGRKQGVTLGMKGSEPFGKPYLWKTIKLVK
ncbi:MAG: carbohydrate binding domain-containing protein [Spirochaetes bacterium]|nr:carbohydrate binding domain-containing protein [Spirochaetota bacterium]